MHWGTLTSCACARAPVCRCMWVYVSLCVQGRVNAGVHLCVACAWRGQSVVSLKLPVLIFFLRHCLQMELDLTNLATLAGQGAPEIILPSSYQCGVANATFLVFFFFVLFYVGAGDQTSNLLNKLFPLSHLISRPFLCSRCQLICYLPFRLHLSWAVPRALIVLLSYLDDGNNVFFSWQQTGQRN